MLKQTPTSWIYNELQNVHEYSLKTEINLKYYQVEKLIKHWCGVAQKYGLKT